MQRARQHLALPNQLTLLRIALIPVIGVMMCNSNRIVVVGAAILFVIAAITDTLDGRLARSRDQVTDLGKLLDPVADKVLVVTILAVLVAQSRLAAWVLVIIVAREFLITVLRMVAAQKGKVIAASSFGKAKTLTQDAMLLLLLLTISFSWLSTVAFIFVGIALVTTVASGMDYLWKYRAYLT